MTKINKYIAVLLHNNISIVPFRYKSSNFCHYGVVFRTLLNILLSAESQSGIFLAWAFTLEGITCSFITNRIFKATIDLGISICWMCLSVRSNVNYIKRCTNILNITWIIVDRVMLWVRRQTLHTSTSAWGQFCWVGYTLKDKETMVLKS